MERARFYAVLFKVWFGKSEVLRCRDSLCVEISSLKGNSLQVKVQILK